MRAVSAEYKDTDGDGWEHCVWGYRWGEERIRGVAAVRQWERFRA